MNGLIAAAISAAFLAPLNLAAVEDIIVPNSALAGGFSVVTREFSPDRKSVRYVFEAPTGIFRFDLNLAGIPLSKITFVIRNQRRCEGLELQVGGGRAVDLRHAKGVTIRQSADDLVIEFLPPALDPMVRRAW